MKQYKIYCWRKYYGFLNVEAKNVEEAELKANELLRNGEEMDEKLPPPDIGIKDIQEEKTNGTRT